MPTSKRPPSKRTPAHNLKRTRKGNVKKRSFFWRWRRAFFLLGVVVVMGFAGLVWVLSQVKLPPSEPPQLQTSFICLADQPEHCTKDNAVASLHGAVNRVNIQSLSEVPEVVQHAVLAAEDRNFFKHGGIDPVGIARAAFDDLTSGTQSQGGSTITQQYVRNVYLTQKRTWTRKVKEAVLAVKIEQKLSKQEIFRRYLNTVYFGRGAYGIQAAAEAYFGVDLKDLDLSQAAFLAGIIRSPGTDPKIASQKDYATKLRHFVLDVMNKSNWVTDAQQKAAEALPIDQGMTTFKPSNGITWLGGPFGPNAADSNGSQYFVSYVTQQLIKLVGEKQAYGGGLRVYTTLDPRLQTDAYNSVTNVLHNSISFSPQPQAALVSVDNQGHVVAMVSGDRPFGSGNGESQVNLAVGKAGGGGGRQAGSSFKPFALAEAVDKGYSIYSGFPAPSVVTIPDGNGPGKPWRVKSEAFGGGYANLVDATTHSLNAVYAELMVKLGPKNVIDMAKRLGVDDDGTAELPAVPAAVLGTVAVSPYDMASAYSTFMDGGEHTEPTAIVKVTDADGHVLWQANSGRRAVLDAGENAKVVYAMSKVLINGTAAGNSLPWDAAGKTGTTEDNGDGWFVGFTPDQLTTAVWMGYPQGQSVTLPSSVYGGTYPARIWHNFMYEALKGGSHTTFPAVTDLHGGEYLSPPVTTAAPTTAPESTTSSPESTSSTTATTAPPPSSSSSTPGSVTVPTVSTPQVGGGGGGPGGRRGGGP